MHEAQDKNVKRIKSPNFSPASISQGHKLSKPPSVSGQNQRFYQLGYSGIHDRNISTTAHSKSCSKWNADCELMLGWEVKERRGESWNWWYWISGLPTLITNIPPALPRPTLGEVFKEACPHSGNSVGRDQTELWNRIKSSHLNIWSDFLTR